jgi:hypothetical protein
LDRRLCLRLLADRRLFFDQAWKVALGKVFYPLDPGGRGRLFDRVWKGQTAFGKVFVFPLDPGRRQMVFGKVFVFRLGPGGQMVLG